MQQTLNAAAQDPAFTQGAAADAWWKAFNEPQLDTLIAGALHDNPTLAVAQARIAQAQEAERIVELESGLRYDSNASVVREHLSQNGLFPPPLGGSTFNEGDISAGVSYTLDWWGRNRARLQAALGERRAAEAEQRAAVLTLADEIADAYFNWQDIAARMKLSRLMVEKREHALRLARERLKRGLDPALPTTEIEQELADERDNSRNLETQSRLLRDRLAALAGRGPDFGAKLAEPPPAADTAFPLPKPLPLDWLAHRPDVAALKWRTEAAAKEIDVASADFYPNVDMNLMLGVQALGLSHWLQAGNWYGSFGPAVHIPLFNVSTLRANLSRKEAEYAESVATYNQALLDAANQVADALAQVSLFHAREQEQRAALASAEHAERLVTERYDNGLIDRLPVLQKEIATLEQQAHESQLHAGKMRAMSALFAALGTGQDAKE